MMVFLKKLAAVAATREYTKPLEFRGQSAPWRDAPPLTMKMGDLAKAKRGLKATLHGWTNFEAGLQPVTRTTEMFKRGYATSKLIPYVGATSSQRYFGIS